MAKTRQSKDVVGIRDLQQFARVVRKGKYTRVAPKTSVYVRYMITTLESPTDLQDAYYYNTR